MACGRAVYVFDTFGGDGWVTPDVYPALEADHFAGQATERVIGRAELERDLSDYDAAMGTANRDLVTQHHRARDHVVEFLRALAERPREERPQAPLRELSRLTAMQWSWEKLARERQQALVELHERLLAAEQAATAANDERSQLHASLVDVDRERAELARRLHLADQAAAEASATVERVSAQALDRAAEIGALRAALDAIYATRAWRLWSRYWHLRATLRNGGVLRARRRSATRRRG
jgi:hypothetical protein